MVEHVLAGPRNSLPAAGEADWLQEHDPTVAVSATIAGFEHSLSHSAIRLAHPQLTRQRLQLSVATIAATEKVRCATDWPYS